MKVVSHTAVHLIAFSSRVLIRLCAAARAAAEAGAYAGGGHAPLRLLRKRRCRQAAGLRLQQAAAHQPQSQRGLPRGPALPDQPGVPLMGRPWFLLIAEQQCKGSSSQMHVSAGSLRSRSMGVRDATHICYEQARPPTRTCTASSTRCAPHGLPLVFASPRTCFLSAAGPGSPNISLYTPVWVYDIVVLSKTSSLPCPKGCRDAFILSSRRL